MVTAEKKLSSEKRLELISAYAGNRFDLVQAGGGNSSVKLDQTNMLIKASGISLSEVSSESGYVSVDYSSIRSNLASEEYSQLDKKQREKSAEQLMKESLCSSSGKPSIETFLHALLNTYTLHTHPITINIITASQDWQVILNELWPASVCVPYQTPGIDLALALVQQLDLYQAKYTQSPSIIFLQNHGLIVSASTHEEVIELTEAVTEKFEQYLGINLTRYRRTTQLQQLFNELGQSHIKCLCNDDQVISSTLSKEDQAATIWPFCPDTLIYCGVHPVFMTSIEDKAALENYQKRFHDVPKILVVDHTVYFCAASLKKAKDTQDLFKFHLLVRQHSNDNIQRLTMDEVAYLSSWDAEKYRQGV